MKPVAPLMMTSPLLIVRPLGFSRKKLELWHGRGEFSRTILTNMIYLVGFGKGLRLLLPQVEDVRLQLFVGAAQPVLEKVDLVQVSVTADIDKRAGQGLASCLLDGLLDMLVERAVADNIKIAQDGQTGTSAAKKQSPALDRLESKKYIFPRTQRRQYE
jgi:hypothetical protein